jgi:hypothetical protein
VLYKNISKKKKKRFQGQLRLGKSIKQGKTGFLLQFFFSSKSIILRVYMVRYTEIFKMIAIIVEFFLFKKRQYMLKLVA